MEVERCRYRLHKGMGFSAERYVQMRRCDVCV